MAKTRESKKRTSHQSAGVVLLGLDDNGKPRAARFAQQHVAAAKKAAKGMGMAVVPITEEIADAAQKLPIGKVSGSGAVSVGPVRANIFNKFAALAGLELPGSEASVPEIVAERKLPLDWDSIGEGDLVLAPASAEVGGFWEATVLGRNADVLNLAWAGWPNEPSFIRTVSSIALLCPAPTSTASAPVAETSDPTSDDER